MGSVHSTVCKTPQTKYTQLEGNCKCWFVVLESSSLDDDWEQEFDIEVTEEDIKLAQEAAKDLAEGDADVSRSFSYTRVLPRVGICSANQHGIICCL